MGMGMNVGMGAMGAMGGMGGMGGGGVGGVAPMQGMGMNVPPDARRRVTRGMMEDGYPIH
jgi:hypothetical protein